MELFKNFRLAVGRQIVNRQLKKNYRIKKFNSLRNAHKIGIVWDGSNIDDFKAITAFLAFASDISASDEFNSSISSNTLFFIQF